LQGKLSQVKAEFFRLGTRPGADRTGVAFELFLTALREIRDLGIALENHTSYVAADPSRSAFYSSLGFRVAEQLPSGKILLASSTKELYQTWLEPALEMAKSFWDYQNGSPLNGERRIIDMDWRPVLGRSVNPVAHNPYFLLHAAEFALAKRARRASEWVALGSEAPFGIIDPLNSNCEVSSTVM